MSRDPAMNTFLQLGAITWGLSSAVNNGLMNAVRRADAHRDRQAAIRYADALSEARARADDLGRMAIASARRIVALEAENRRLKTALDQRQAFIDRLRKRSV